MGIYRDVYDFAAKAGALEGYVYHGDKVDPSYLPNWIDNLVEKYNALPPEVLAEIQGSCDETLGRAVRSLTPFLGENDEVINKLKSLIAGRTPQSPDDFPKYR